VLARGTEMLANGLAAHSAVPAFATYNLEMVQAVTAAAEQTDRPVIMLAGASHFHHAGRSALISMALQAAHTSTAPVGVHLDHSRDLAEIEQCTKAGYSSVMADVSPLPFEDNIALTRAAVAIAHPAGVWVEEELGAIPGDEDVSTDATPPQTMTAPGCRVRRTDGGGRPGSCRRQRPRPHQHTDVPRPATADRDPVRRPRPARPARRERPAPPAAQRSHRLRCRQGQHQHRAPPGLLAVVQKVLPEVLSTHDSVALWRAGREAVTNAAVHSIHALTGHS
jgi:tagatose 1,6-diphosphate aldolase GatY/KbaY